MPFTLQEIIKTWNAIYKTDIVLEFEDFINALEDLEEKKEEAATWRLEVETGYSLREDGTSSGGNYCKSEDCKNPVSTVDFHMGDAERSYCEKCYQEDQ